MIVDSHAHLDLPQFDADRHDVIMHARDEGVELIITIATSAPQSACGGASRVTRWLFRPSAPIT